MISLSNLARLAKACLGGQRFLKDERGVSAIEFALIAPIMISAYLGMAELTLGMMASRRASHLAATVGDLAAQSESLSTANITDLFSIGASIMMPFDTGTKLQIRLTSVTMGADGKARVDWSDAQNMTAYAKTTIIPAVTTAQIASGESLIMTDVNYKYDSPVGALLPGTTTFSDTYYHHPRIGAAVVRQ